MCTHVHFIQEPPAPQKVEEVSTEAHDASTLGAALEESPTGSTVQLIGPSPQEVRVFHIVLLSMQAAAKVKLAALLLC